MTTQDDGNIKQYTGNGVTSTFSTGNIIFYDAEDLIVTTTVIATGEDSILTYGVGNDYTVSGGEGDSGSITLLSGALPSTKRITIQRSIPYTQTDDYVEGGSILAETVESAFDRSVIRDQQLRDEANRSLKFSPTLSTSLVGRVVEAPVDGRLLAWSGNSGDVVNGVVGDLSGEFDTLFSGLASGDFLKYDGSQWVNSREPRITSIPTAPTANDDSGDGYILYDKVVTGDTGEIYITTDVTVGAAVWQQTSLDSDDLGALAVLDTVNDANWSGADLEIENGGTGASSAAAARTNLDVYSTSEVDALTSQRTSWADVGTDLDDFSGTAASVTNTYGANLDRVETRLVCLVSEGGYAAGDIVDVGASIFFGLNTSYGMSVSYDDTNVTFSGGTLQWFMSPKAGGTAFDPTPTSWKLQYRLIKN